MELAALFGHLENKEPVTTVSTGVEKAMRMSCIEDSNEGARGTVFVCRFCLVFAI